MRSFYRLCNRLKFYRLSNAISYAHASQYRWKMLPQLIPVGLTNYRLQSFVNGWQDKYQLGWISEIDENGDTEW